MRKKPFSMSYLVTKQEHIDIMDYPALTMQIPQWACENNWKKADFAFLSLWSFSILFLQPQTLNFVPILVCFGAATLLHIHLFRILLLWPSHKTSNSSSYLKLKTEQNLLNCEDTCITHIAQTAVLTKLLSFTLSCLYIIYIHTSPPWCQITLTAT